MDDALLNRLTLDLSETVQRYAGERIKRLNVLNQNGANLSYLHGQDMAKKLGLEDVAGNITPYPPTTNIVIEQPHAQPAAKNGTAAAPPPATAKADRPPTQGLAARAAPWIAAAGIGLGSGLGGAALTKYLTPTAEPAASTTGTVGIQVR